MENCKCKSIVRTIIYFLVIVGALNWGLVGAFRFDLVAYLLGDMTIASRIVYITIGLAALVKIIYILKNRN